MMTTRVERTLVKLALTGACGRAGNDYCQNVLTSKGNKMSKRFLSLAM